jgi:hypothetical protein
MSRVEGRDVWVEGMGGWVDEGAEQRQWRLRGENGWMGGWMHEVMDGWMKGWMQ